MHAEAYQWLQYVVSAHVLPSLFGQAAVLEFGARDVNGSARPLFPGAAYVGVDVQDGPGVEIVADAADFDGHQLFDVVVCTETLEHCQSPWRVLASAYRALRSGGMFLVTAAAPPRQPHRCDGTQGELGGEHYANIVPADLDDELHRLGFHVSELRYDAMHGDVYALAVKP